VNDQIFSSSIKHDCSNPSWENDKQEFYFHFTPPTSSSYLVIELYDWDWFWRDHMIGSCAITLSSLIHMKGKSKGLINYERTVLATATHANEPSYEIALGISVISSATERLKRLICEVYEYEMWDVEQGWTTPSPFSPTTVTRCFRFIDRHHAHNIFGDNLDEVSEKLMMMQNNMLIERDWTLYQGYSSDTNGWCYSQTFDAEFYHTAEVRASLFRRRLWRRFYKQSNL